MLHTATYIHSYTQTYIHIYRAPNVTEHSPAVTLVTGSLATIIASKPFDRNCDVVHLSINLSQ